MKKWLETIAVINISRMCDGCNKFQYEDTFEPKNENHCSFPSEFFKLAKEGKTAKKPKFIETNGIVMKCKNKQAHFEHIKR